MQRPIHVGGEPLASVMGLAPCPDGGRSRKGAVPTRCLFYRLSRATQRMGWLCPSGGPKNSTHRMCASGSDPFETWAQPSPPGALNPLILAFEDKDERVRARMQQLIEQDGARKAE
ncbi:MAG TPA: hypothetical protein VK901_12150 [Nitrospiraceae bacterium]|nr:hypothetical protein [Nitrospiraceae bacterium]